MPEVVIDSIRVSMVNYQRVVILKEKATNRYLPIWIGPAEADSIAVRLQDMAVPRPLTHDLLCTLVDSLGGVIESISVSDLQKDTFIATLNVRVNDKAVEVDCRPSDALAIAVRTKVAIYVEEAVLEKAAVSLDEDGNPVEPPPPIGEPQQEVEMADEEQPPAPATPPPEGAAAGPPVAPPSPA